MNVNNLFLTRAVSIYKILYYSEKYAVQNKVLDCGAGGDNPPCYIFYTHGYQAHGIDIDKESIEKSARFCCKRKCTMEIKHCDMRNIEYGNKLFGAVYSYNSIFHMSKPDILISINEMTRVAEPGGIIYFNLLHKKDCGYGSGIEIEKDTFKDSNDGIIHTYHEENEIDDEIKGSKLLEKEVINNYQKIDGEWVSQWFIEYYLRKDEDKI